MINRILNYILMFLVFAIMLIYLLLYNIKAFIYLASDHYYTDYLGCYRLLARISKTANIKKP